MTRGRRATGRWAALGVVLVVVAGVLVVLAIGDTPSGDGPARATDSVSSAPSPAREAAQPPPEHLTIASIGVSTELVGLGLRSDRTVEVPRDAAQAGWFEEGPVPGQLGSSVILGHVDSTEGPAVFHELSDLRPGEAIEVRRADGTVAEFEVDRVATYENEDFPAQAVYAGSPGEPALNLVTCGGEYDKDRGGWQSNVVVFAAFVGVRAS
ncbi:MAG: class F sortase [Aeromicrobium sp.]